MEQIRSAKSPGDDLFHSLSRKTNSPQMNPKAHRAFTAVGILFCQPGRVNSSTARECASASAQNWKSRMSELGQPRVFRTARLEMEPITAMHAIEAWPHLDDARMWAFFPNLRPKSLEALRATYGRWENPHHAEGELRENWACRERRSRQMVGTIQATTLLSSGVCYIAYGVFMDYQRQGYARESVAALLNHLRGVSRIRTVFAEMAVENVASFKLVESLGFKRKKRHRTVDTVLGVDGDAYLYELVL